MKLNKLQRHTAYIIMLAEMEKSKQAYGFCNLTRLVFGWNDTNENESESGIYLWAFNTKYLPELEKKNHSQHLLI